MGQALLTIAGFIASKNGFYLALAARVIFGLGGESLNVCQSTAISRWFFGKELAFALGVNITVSRLGSVINNAVEPPIADKTSLGWGFGFGFVICVFSWVCGLAMVYMEKLADKKDKSNTQLNADDLEVVRLKDMKSLGICYWIITFNCLFTYLGIFPFNNISTEFFREKYNFD